MEQSCSAVRFKLARQMFTIENNTNINRILFLYGRNALWYIIIDYFS